MPRAFLALAAVLSLLAIALPSTAAASPTNDLFANATAIDPSLSSFTDYADIGSASTEQGEPQNCYYAVKTVWYSITPTTSETVKVNLGGSSFYDTELNVYRQDGTDISGLSFLNCLSFGGGSPISFDAQAGKTYYIQAGSIYGSSGTLQLNVQALRPPANDNFAKAAPINAVPFSDSFDTSVATVESGEPTPSCGYGQSAGTVWYAFTPSSSGSYSASPGFYAQVAAYTGTSLTNLNQIGCRAFGPLTFHADAGMTYYLQVGGIYGTRGPMTFSINVAPNPIVSLSYYPTDPSIFDAVQFYDGSYDPAGAGISSESWSFGDGATATGCCPRHTFAADGDYSVKLTVGTPDGRTASKTQTVHVQTHDVTINKFTVPQSASSGQTRQLSVGVTNSRYSETVQVQLLASVPGGGFQQVGVLQQAVAARGTNHPTTFAFSYTFTSADASVGKVTFQAIATIVGARDAQLSDNSAIALPTKVNG
jgi:hypothetical protein